MSQFQWSAMTLSDESYAGASSYQKLKETVTDFTGYESSRPPGPRRGEERLLAVDHPQGHVRPLQNILFDITRGHAQLVGARPVDLLDEFSTAKFRSFKDNMDTARLERFIAGHGAEFSAYIVMTVTNNSAGWQHISNIRETYQIARTDGLLVLFDVACYADNGCP